MLNIIPASLARPKPPLSGSARRTRAAVPKRRRGGQPRNSNARKHGLYAARNPHPESRTLQKVEGIDVRLLHLDALQAPMDVLAGIMVRSLGMMDSKEPKKVIKVGHAIFNRALRKFNALCKEKSAILLHYYRIVNLARDASLLIQHEFLGLPKHPIFVPLGFEKNCANLKSAAPILTDQQWFLMQETFRTLRLELDSSRKYKRRKPRLDERFLMQGILLKLAFHVDWNDIPKLFHTLHPNMVAFPVRASHRLYRQLFNSGRLSAIYEVLYSHLHVYGDTTLEDLVEQGCFQIENNRVCLAPGQKITWQKFTALLLLQRALFNQRIMQREQNEERRAQGGYLRLPSLHSRSPKYTAHPPAFESAYVMEESEINFQPLEKSPAFQKWQSFEKINEIGRVPSPDTRN